jgi:hypothetical protein
MEERHEIEDGNPVNQKLDNLQASVTQLLGVVRSQAEKQALLEARIRASELTTKEKEEVVSGPEDFRQRFGAHIRTEDPREFLQRCLSDDDGALVTPWEASLPPGSRETVLKLLPEKMIPASGVSPSAAKIIKADPNLKAKLSEVSASTTAMRGILNALAPLVEAISKGGDPSLTQNLNILSYLTVAEASRQQRVLRNLGRTAIGEEEITYDRFRVNADQPDEELYSEKKERESLATTLSQAFSTSSKKRKRHESYGSSKKSYTHHPQSQESSNQRGRGSGSRGTGTRGRGFSQRGRD